MPIPDKIKNPLFRFIKVNPKSKAPLEKDWVKENNYAFDDPIFKDFLKTNPNYGVVCGYGNLAVIDCDEEILKVEVENNLPKTFTVKTGSGGSHFYYIIPDLEKKIIVEDQKKNHYGEIQSFGSQVIGPGSIHPNSNKYEIIEDRDIAQISVDELYKGLAAFIKKKQSKQQSKVIKIQDVLKYEFKDFVKLIDIIDLSGFEEVADGYQGPHPMHGSESGKNLHIMTESNTWHCFRCNYTGGPLELIAVLNNIIKCGDKLTGTKRKQAIDLAKKKYGLDPVAQVAKDKNIISAKLSSSSWVELRNNQDIIKYNFLSDGSIKWDVVYRGDFAPIKILIMDESKLHQIKTNKKLIGTLPELLDMMVASGGVYKKALLADCVNAILSDSNLPVEHGESAYGVYLNDNKMYLCLEPYSVTDAQKRVERQLIPAIDEELTKEKILEYIDLLKYWHPYEVYPVFSYAIMGSFGLLLRYNNILVPNLWHVSSETNIGKSLTARIFSQHLYGIITGNPNDINNDFRMTEDMDAICLCHPIDECTNLHPDLYDKIKQSAENPIQGKRGNANLSSRIFKSRKVYCITSNRFPITNKQALVRFLKIEFDASKKGIRSDRKVTRTLTKKVKDLSPIGFRLVEHELKDLDYKFENLEKRIINYGNQISDFYSISLSDARRIDAWGLVYEGLKAWERVCKQYKINWKAPDIPSFYKSVVKPIEEYTFETKRLTLEVFLDWFNVFLSIDKDYKDGSYKSENILWKNHIVKDSGQEFTGIIITMGLLEKYNASKKEDKEMQFASLSDLARSTLPYTNLTINTINMSFRFGEQVKKGVFIEDKILNNPISELKNKFSIGIHEKPGYMVTKSGSTGGKTCYSKPKKTVTSTVTNNPKEKCYKKLQQNNKPAVTNANVTGPQQEKKAMLPKCNQKQHQKVTASQQEGEAQNVTMLPQNLHTREELKKLKNFLKTHKKHDTFCLYRSLTGFFDPGFIDQCIQRKIIIKQPNGIFVFNEG